MDKETCVTSETSEVILLEIFLITSQGSSGTVAVIASTEEISLITTRYPKSLWSPLTPVTLVSVKTAKYCQSSLSRPAFSTSSLTIASAALSIARFSLVKGSITLTARPGPGNGCLWTMLSGRPSSVPISRTSSLYKSLIGSQSSNTIPLGSARLWCDLIWPLVSIQSGAIVP